MTVYDEFLFLVSIGIGTRTVNDSLLMVHGSDSFDWNELKALAEKHGLSAVVLDGIERLPNQQRPPKVFLLEWIGETLQGYEYRYELYCRAIAEMAAFYREFGFKMMVLKGYVCSLDWPKPEHRPCGDIDIWQFGQQKEADEALIKEKGIEIDTSHHHHTVFYWRDFMVENHYDFINVHHHKSHKAFERILKQLGADNSHFVEVYGEKVYLPSPNLHALFLLKHLLLHFTSEEITIRQVLDWAFFVKRHGKEVDWDWLLPVLEEYYMRDFFNIINAICVEDLGFEKDFFPVAPVESSLKERVLNDIMKPEFEEDVPKRLVARALLRYRRWKANGWKHKLCYEESMWSAFWSGVWNHLLKPSSI